MLGVDVSNYTAPLTPARLDLWHDLGVRLVIVQAIDPAPPYPPTKTKAQMDFVLADGRFCVDVYVEQFFGGAQALAFLERQLRLVDGYKYRQLWNAVEDTSLAQSAEQNIADIAQALALCDDLNDGTTDIYTGRWFWPRYMGDTSTFSRWRHLWDADYDHVPDVRDFAPYGGWEERRIKQYEGTAIGGDIDWDVLSPAETDEVNSYMGWNMMPSPECYDLENAMGYIHGDLVAALREAAGVPIRKWNAKAQARLLNLIQLLETTSEQ